MATRESGLYFLTHSKWLLLPIEEAHLSHCMSSFILMSMPIPVKFLPHFVLFYVTNHVYLFKQIPVCDEVSKKHLLHHLSVDYFNEPLQRQKATEAVSTITCVLEGKSFLIIF